MFVAVRQCFIATTQNYRRQTKADHTRRDVVKLAARLTWNLREIKAIFVCTGEKCFVKRDLTMRN